jgi:hypothetical protein
MPLDATVLDIQPYLHFDVAYARWGSGYSDSLAVMVSTDCGVTYQQVYLKGGTTLATSPDNQSFFIPTNDQWRTDSVDLSAYFGQTNVQVAFRNIGGWGNAIYIDNVNLGSLAGLNTAKLPSISMYPNPIQAGTCLTIQGDGIEKVTLVNQEGKKIKSISFASGSTFELPEQLAAGTYIIQLETKNQLINKPLIIIR